MFKEPLLIQTRVTIIKSGLHHTQNTLLTVFTIMSNYLGVFGKTHSRRNLSKLYPCQLGKVSA
jgi:hypothetical protein